MRLIRRSSSVRGIRVFVAQKGIRRLLLRTCCLVCCRIVWLIAHVGCTAGDRASLVRSSILRLGPCVLLWIIRHMRRLTCRYRYPMILIASPYRIACMRSRVRVCRWHVLLLVWHPKVCAHPVIAGWLIGGFIVEWPIIASFEASSQTFEVAIGSGLYVCTVVVLLFGRVVVWRVLASVRLAVLVVGHLIWESSKACHALFSIYPNSSGA